MRSSLSRVVAVPCGWRREELSRTHTELGERVFELFKDKPLDRELDGLVERIKVLRQQPAAGESPALGQQAVADPS